MPWLKRWFGPGSELETALFLKLRLTRWRHFLHAQRACLDLLADLREKLEEEYIFDRQYIHSTLGLIFQKAFQAAYDRGILEKDQGTEMYEWLDRLQAQAGTSIQNKSLARDGMTRPLSLKEDLEAEHLKGGGKDFHDPQTEDWVEEPEYRMIRGALEILDPPGPVKTIDSLTLSEEKLPSLRQGLQMAHARVLSTLFQPADWQRWIQAGLARPYQEDGSVPVSLINLEEGLEEEISGSKKGQKAQTHSELESLSSTPWVLFWEALSSNLPSSGFPPGQEDLSLSLMVSENSFFLTGIVSGKKIFMDVVLTSVRELNHFFFRWEEARSSPKGPHPLIRLFEWTYQEGNRLFEVGFLKQSAQEIERHLTLLGQACNSMIKNRSKDI